MLYTYGSDRASFKKSISDWKSRLFFLEADNSRSLCVYRHTMVEAYTLPLDENETPVDRKGTQDFATLQFAYCDEKGKSIKSLRLMVDACEILLGRDFSLAMVAHGRLLLEWGHSLPMPAWKISQPGVEEKMNRAKLLVLGDRGISPSLSSTATPTDADDQCVT